MFVASGALALLTLVIVLGLAERSSAHSSPILGQPFDLAVGQAATIADTGLEVSFLRVLEDSRCPAQVMCIWSGRASIELEVRAPGEPAQIVVLSTCCPPADADHASVAGQVIGLVELAPVPLQPEDVGAAAYTAQLVVTPEPQAGI
ncbi:MAG TPA: hypothetical protein VFA49_11490 [Chloroflexota bacterium]|nr:hypothetical protein [Chloroflexota bacterium]